MSGKYDDIIDLPHPEPQTHPRMPMRDRAAQFAPFAALTGHRAALAETERRVGGGAGERAVLGAVACGAELVFRDGVCLGGAAAIQAPSRPDKTSGDEAAIRPPNVIKLSKSAHTKKYPPRKIEVGIFYAFVMWFACAYFAGRTMTCPS